MDLHKENKVETFQCKTGRKRGICFSFKFVESKSNHMQIQNIRLPSLCFVAFKQEPVSQHRDIKSMDMSQVSKHLLQPALSSIAQYYIDFPSPSHLTEFQSTAGIPPAFLFTYIFYCSHVRFVPGLDLNHEVILHVLILKSRRQITFFICWSEAMTTCHSEVRQVPYTDSYSWSWLVPATLWMEGCET